MANIVFHNNFSFCLAKNRKTCLNITVVLWFSLAFFLLLALTPSFISAEPSAKDTLSPDATASPAVKSQTSSLTRDKTMLARSGRASRSAEQPPTKKKKFTVGSQLPDMDKAIQKTIKTLLYFIGIILIVASIYKRIKKASPTKRGNQIAIIAREPVTPKCSLLIAEIEGERFLLSSSSESLSLISQLESQKSFDASLDKILLERASEETFQKQKTAVTG